MMDDPMRIKNFVITGTLSQKRKDIEELCAENGDVLQKSITKKTDYLVVGDSPGKSKLEKAKEYGIQTVSEEEFMIIMEGE